MGEYLHEIFRTPFQPRRRIDCSGLADRVEDLPECATCQDHLACQHTAVRLAQGNQRSRSKAVTTILNKASFQLELWKVGP